MESEGVYQTSKDTVPAEGLFLLTEGEMKLIRRIRSLHSGNHLAIIHIDGDGVAALTLLGTGSIEKLRKKAGQV